MHRFHFTLSPDLLLLLMLVVLLSGCSTLTSSDLPTIMPTDYIPTAIALTVQAQGINLPSETQPLEAAQPLVGSKTEAMATAPVSVTITPIPPIPTSTPTSLSPALTPINSPSIPYGRIQIIAPGPLSKVVSPFNVKAFLVPGASGVVKMELLGEDGRLLMREVRIYDTPPGVQVTVGLEMSFEISGVAEAGRVQVSVEDEYKRTVALSSVDVILLSLGESDLNPPGDLLEDILIQEPVPNALIQGGTMLVSGLARTHTLGPLMIELQTDDGRIIGTRQVAVDDSIDGHHSTFMIDVPYTINTPTKARLLVWENGEHIPGITHLSSLEVLLSP
jgi:hypothetical protein